MSSVLIIEDDELTAAGFARSIRANGKHTVHIADSFASALRHIEQHDCPDVVSMDLFLAGDSSVTKNHFLSVLKKTSDENKSRDPQFNSPRIAIMSGAPSLVQEAMQIQQRYSFRATSISKPAPIEKLLEYIEADKNHLRNLDQSLSKQYEIAAAFPPLTLEQAIRGLEPQITDDGYIRSYPYPPALENIELALRLKPENILSVYHAQVDATEEQIDEALLFQGGIGQAVIGQVVFNIDNIAKLKDKNPNLPIFLVGQQHTESVLKQSSLISGAINFSDEPIAHFSEIARNKGLSILTITPTQAKNEGIVLTDDSLSYNGNVIRESDMITLNPSENLLHLSELPIKPAKKPERFEVLEKAVKNMRSFMRFSAQAETAEGVKSARGDIKLSKMENYFQYKDGGVEILNTYLFNPTEENLNAVKEFIKDYIQEEMVDAHEGDCLRKPSFRLIDFKPNEFLKTDSDFNKLREIHGIDDLSGTNLAVALPDLYRVQVESILEVLGPTGEVFEGLDGEDDYPVYLFDILPYLIVPMVEDTSHYNMMKSLISNTIKNTWGSGYVDQVQICPMIESMKAIYILPSLLPVARVYIGGSDLMSDIMGGISRSDEKSIHEWMQDNETYDHPFRSIPAEMEKALKEIKLIVDKSNDAIREDRSLSEFNGTYYSKIYFSGIQAQHFQAIKDILSTGIYRLTVPADDYHLEGLPMAMCLVEESKKMVSDHEIYHQNHIMMRRAEFS